MVGLQHTLSEEYCVRLNNNISKYILWEFQHYAKCKDIYLSVGIGPTKLLHYQGFVDCLFIL